MMMEKQHQVAVRQCDLEVMKMAVLKHEETFRQQVHELHRLYRIQRQLMSGLQGGRSGVHPTSSARRISRRSSKQPRRALDLQLPADEYIVSTDEEDQEDVDEAGLELTLALGGTARRRSVNRRQERNSSGGGGSPFASDCSGASLLSSSPPSSLEYCSDDGPAAVGVQALPPCQSAMAFGEGMLRQQHAPWLVQCHQYLSLRMT